MSKIMYLYIKKVKDPSGFKHKFLRKTGFLGEKILLKVFGIFV